jgi:hypothetical protein
MYGPIEDSYFTWLSNKVDYVAVPTPSLKHENLLRKLHATEFVWTISGDDNRAAKGLELRDEFLYEIQELGDPYFDNTGVSVLEMLVALANDIEFQMDESMSDWFWLMLDNLGISDFTDAYEGSDASVSDILDRFIWRQYGPDGFGGLFPLTNFRQDQSKVEVWYQFHAYLEDNDL